MLYNESDQTNIATFTKEGASRKYYTSFYIHIQPVEEIKFMQIFFGLLFIPRGILPVNSNVWIAIFMQLFLAALDKIIFRDYNYNSVIYHCYIGGVQN